MTVVLGRVPQLKRLFRRFAVILCSYYLLRFLLNYCVRDHGSRKSSSRSSSSFRSQKIKSARPWTTISCIPNTGVCLFTNLYFLNGELHAYVGSNSVYQHPAWNNVRLQTGIGFSSPIFQLVSHHQEKIDTLQFSHDKESGIVLPFNPDFYNASESGETDSTNYIPIHLHRSMPPLTLSVSTPYFVEPVHLISWLWPNFFRILYAGMASYYTLMENGIFFPDHIRYVFTDKPTPAAFKFLTLFDSITHYPSLHMDALKSGIYKTFLVGLSRDFAISELELEPNSDWSRSRGVAARHFATRIKQAHWPALDIAKPILPIPSIRSKNRHPRVTLLVRPNNRKILNLDLLVNHLKTFPINLSIHSFDTMSLKKQIAIISQTDVFVSMHGAALAHIIFLPPSAKVIELFPFGFRKRIYANLACMVGVGYTAWENHDWTRSVPHWDIVEQNRYTTRSQQEIVNNAVDWYNMDSKNYWRNQDTHVDVFQVSALMDRSLQALTAPRYMTYMPWEQFNNQILALKSGCAMAKFLDRTLVVPPFGFKRSEGESYDLFEPAEYEWYDHEKYLSIKDGIPCSTISWENYWTLTGHLMDLNDGGWEVRYHLISNKTTHEQIDSWYQSSLKLNFKALGIVPKQDPENYMLSQNELTSLFQSNKKMLAMGNIFWYHDFGVKQSYPLKSTYVHELLENEIYKSFVDSYDFNHVLISKSTHLAQHLTMTPYIAIHLRRKDYKKKCEEYLHRRSVYSSCYPSQSEIRHLFITKYPPEQYKTLYISTNDAEEILSLRGSLKEYNILSWDDLDLKSVETNPPKHSWDPIERMVADMVICRAAAMFVGNLFSSLSRHVIESREKEGKEWDVWR